MTAYSSTASSRSGEPSPDRYIGSFITLTSKSEIRYEGILYNINTDEASIGLRNVRSYGTEGRKTDGPPVPPSDKVYEYILFRGSDIKFLQVKASPPAEATSPSINSDPAIIQSHFPGATMPPTSLPTAPSTHLTDLGSHSPQMSPTFQSGLPTAPNPYLTNLGSYSSQMGPTFQSGLPTAPTGNLTDLGSHSSQMGPTFQSGQSLHQPGGNMNSWGASPPNMPMYWPGYYGTPNWTPQMPHHSLLHPPHGLSAPPSLQHMQFSGFNPSLPISSTLPSSNLPEYHSLVPNSTSSSNLTSSSLPASSFSLNAHPLQPMALPSIYNFLPNKAPISTITTSAPSSSLPSLTSLSTSVPYNAPVPSLVSKPIVTTGPSAFASQTLSSQPIRTESTTPSLITPAELLQPVPQPLPVPMTQKEELLQPVPQTLPVPMTQKEELLQPVPQTLPVPMTQKEELLQPVPQTLPVPMTQKDVEVVQVSAKQSSEPLGPVVTKPQPPLLPLPTNARPHKPNGSSYHNMHSHYRGRGGRGGPGGKGPGVSRPVSKFTEEFDFMAMNEKFNKDEVWGHLGKSNKFKDENNFGSDEDVYGTESPKIEMKPVYKKDDFFDSLSSNGLDNGPNHMRPRYSEQLKLDTETFGDFSSYSGGRGGGRGHGGYVYGDWGRGGGGYRDRDRGRGGYGDGGRGRGGYEDRGSGRGRGGFEDRGNGRGRGRGGFEDRGNGRGRGGFEDRGSGRGRGGYEDRGRGRGGFEDRGSGRGRGGYEDRGRGRGA